MSVEYDQTELAKLADEDPHLPGRCIARSRYLPPPDHAADLPHRRAVDRQPGQGILRRQGHAGLRGRRAAQEIPPGHRLRQAPEHVRSDIGDDKEYFSGEAALKAAGGQHDEPVLVIVIPEAKRQPIAGWRFYPAGSFAGALIERLLVARGNTLSTFTPHARSCRRRTKSRHRTKSERRHQVEQGTAGAGAAQRRLPGSGTVAHAHGHAHHGVLAAGQGVAVAQREAGGIGGGHRVQGQAGIAGRRRQRDR